MTSHSRALLAIASALAVAVAPVVASAQAAAACWHRNVERLDHALHPSRGGDEAFFTRTGGPPNTFFLLANGTRTKELPGFSIAQVPAAERGCGRSTFLNTRLRAGSTYAKATNYPDVDPGQGPSQPGNSDKGFPSYFDGGKAYRYLNWTTTAATAETTNAACDAVYSSTDARRAECRTCLANEKSYYLHPTDDTPGKQVFHGNFLRFYPPTHVMLRRVFKKAVVDIQRVRMGVVHFAENLPGVNPHGGVLQEDLNPSCNLLGDTSASWTSNRGSIVGKWDGNGQTPGFGDAGKVVETPLGEALLGIGARYADLGLVDPTYVPAGFLPRDHSTGANDNQDAICVTCQFSSVIVIGDGSTPSPALDERIPSAIKDLETVPLEARIRLGNACTPANAPDACGPHLACDTATGTCRDVAYFDNVAAWIGNRDLRNGYCGSEAHSGGRCDPEQQRVATYTIAIGQDSALYESAARAGQGMYFRADDADQLGEAIKGAIRDILRRATSFSTAATSTVQTQGTTYAYIPRFRPSPQARWEGWLYRFDLFNEFAAGCQLSDTQAPFDADKRSRNPNADGDCDDVFLKDANGRYVGENEDGEFVLLDTTRTPWEPSETRATPVWEAAKELTRRHQDADPRSIWTIVDADGDGRYEPEEELELSATNVTSLTPYLALGGVAGPFCTALSNRLLATYASEADCVRDVIEFVRGRDVFDEDEDLDTTEARPKILGDIYHSSPVLVTPPAPRHLCDLGVVNQCTFSLYGRSLTPNGEAAYDAWRAAQEDRDQFVLVGANDGMLHAFNAGTRRTGDDPSTAVVEPSTHEYFDLGTGRELWAFVPPDQLAKLHRLITEERHELFVDGTPMLRDVWVDAADPGRKDADEFHTLAVVGERGGGRHVFALDVTDPARPHWRWGHPGPGTTAALAAGQSWADFAPSPPPVVPIALDDPDGPLTVAGRKARENWVVFLNGGYDPDLVRGRSVNVLDAWTGAPLWSFGPRTAAVGDPGVALSPVAAAVAVLDLGEGPSVAGAQDGLFDTAVFGDLAGQVWTARFHVPGRDNDTDGDVDNWFGARAFVQYDSDGLQKRSPFFHMPSAAVLLDSGVPRIYLGSGDRQNIRDSGGGACGLDGLGACVRKDCDVTVEQPTYDTGSKRARRDWTFTGGATLARDAATFDTQAPGISCTDPLTATNTVRIDCGTPVTYTSSISCDWSVPGGACVEVPRPRADPIAKTATTENARFYSLRLFDGADRRPFASAADAQRYDGAALTDADLVNADATLASSTGNGFYVPFSLQDERTASASGIVSGCVLWNTLNPLPGNSACGKGQGDLAKLYRANYATGASTCGVWTTPTAPPRAVARNSLVPPPPPAPLIAVNDSSGEVRFSILSMEAGREPTQMTVGSGDVAGLVHWIEVPRRTHQCRHEGVACR